MLAPNNSTSHCLDENTALELLDGTLPTSARTNVEKHLEECDLCRELVAELAQIGRAVSGEIEARSPDTIRTPHHEEGSSSDAKDEHILAPGTVAGPYRIEQPIGAGAAGTVYRAVDQRSGQVVALKHVEDAAMRTRFHREAEILRRLDHPGIVRYIDHGETPGGAMYLAMEWLEGEDLEHHLRQRALESGLQDSRKIPWREARVIGDRLASALAHAHAFGAVHRDLSPKNVFLANHRVDQAKLLDFGLVRVPDAIAGPERTASQAVLGTPYYMSPEQVRDPKSVDARSDLFGLGVLLFEMLSGKRPFTGEDLFTVWVKIVDQPTPDLRVLVPEVPEPFVRLVEALLAKEPDARPPSAADVHSVLAKLEGVPDGHTARAVTAPPPPHSPAQPPVSTSTAPMLRPLQYPTRPTPPPSPASPPKRGSGAFVAASVGVGVTALVATTTLAVVYGRGGTGSGAAASSEVEGNNTPATNKPSTKPEEPASANAAEDETSQSTPHLSCGGDDVVVKKQGRYRPNPALPKGVGNAVFVGGNCKLTLEDCVIEGPSSLLIMNEAVVTLRRCKVLGKVTMVGPKPTLHLHETTLPQAPAVTGGGKVIKHP